MVSSFIEEALLTSLTIDIETETITLAPPAESYDLRGEYTGSWIRYALDRDPVLNLGWTVYITAEVVVDECIAETLSFSIR